MPAAHDSNGYIRLSTLMWIVGPVAAAIAGFTTLAIAPMQKDIQSNADAIRDIRIDLVPRKEHDRDWYAQDQRFGDLQRQIDANRVDIKSIYTPSDAIKGLGDRLDKLEVEMHDKSTKQ